MQKYTLNLTLLHYINRKLQSSDHLLGTPETSRRGRSTRKARRALTSNPPGLPPWPCGDGWVLAPSPSPLSSLVKNSKTTLKSLSGNKDIIVFKYSLNSDNCFESQLNNLGFFFRSFGSNLRQL